MEIYATIEAAKDHLQARILEAGKEPYLFDAGLLGNFATQGDLIRIVQRHFKHEQPGATIIFVSGKLFARVQKEQEASI